MEKVTEAQVREILKTVMDPELGVNIVDLGLIYQIEVGGEKLHITMTLTTPGCPLGGWFVKMVQETIEKELGVASEKVLVEITFDPPWSQDAVSPEIKAQLGID